MKKDGKPIHGWLVLDKPAGITSSKAVLRVRHLFGAAKAGHIGTLDPMATGCLPIALGDATKTIPFLTDESKAYEWEMSFGQKTTTGDKEGDVIEENPRTPTAQELRAALPHFIGKIQQRPPNFSALKVAGRAAYKKARAGEVFELPLREIQIDEIVFLGLEGNRARLRCVCQKGVYIRTLAEDIAEKVSSLAHLTELRRTQNGCFLPPQFISLDKVEKIVHSEDEDDDTKVKNLNDLLLPVVSVLTGLPLIHLNAEQAERLRMGQKIQLLNYEGEENKNPFLVLENEKPVGLACLEERVLKPKRIFNL